MSQGRILIVEPDPVSRRDLVTTLQRAGYVVRAVAGASAASGVVLRFRPDVIMLDMDAPQYSGPDFHECLRSTRRGCRIPVVYLSAEDNWIQREIAEQQGAFALITRPIHTAEILNAIRDALTHSTTHDGALVAV